MDIADIVMKYKTSTLLEYTSEDIVGPIFVQLLRKILEYHSEPPVEVVVTDFVDALPIYLHQAELLNINTDFINDISVIKVGGKINVGNVLYKVPISPYPVYKARYGEALSNIMAGKDDRVKLNLQIGIDMIMNLFDRKELIEQIHDIGRQIIQNKDVINVVFINVEAVREASFEALPLLRLMFPIVLQLERGGEGFVVKKSVFPKLRGIRGEV